MKKKKIYTPEEKAIILREHLDDNIPISDLAEKYGIHPNAVYTWKKQLFEQAPKSLERKRKAAEQAEANRDKQRIAELEALLARREKLISEIVSENIELKKNTSGEVFALNGLNPIRGTK